MIAIKYFIKAALQRVAFLHLAGFNLIYFSKANLQFMPD